MCEAAAAGQYAGMPGTYSLRLYFSRRKSKPQPRARIFSLQTPRQSISRPYAGSQRKQDFKPPSRARTIAAACAELLKCAPMPAWRRAESLPAASANGRDCYNFVEQAGRFGSLHPVWFVL